LAELPLNGVRVSVECANKAHEDVDILPGFAERKKARKVVVEQWCYCLLQTVFLQLNQCFFAIIQDLKSVIIELSYKCENQPNRFWWIVRSEVLLQSGKTLDILEIPQFIKN
jgi:hypothetical protein